MHARNSRSRAAALLLACAALILIPEAAAAQDGSPLRKSDLIRMLAANTYSVGEVADLVRKSCVDFEPTARDRSDLKRLEGQPVLDVIASCRTKSEAREKTIIRGTPVTLAPSDTPDVGSTGTALAGETRLPTDLQPTGRASESAPGPSRLVQGSELTAISSKPRLSNPSEVSQWLLDNYRPAIRRSGNVVIRMFVDVDGKVSLPEILETSGDASMDATAIRAAEVMTFTPAESRGKPVGSWTIQRIVLQAR
ncbi:MAG: TonB family protein [Gemmatimonadota bacterium]